MEKGVLNTLILPYTQLQEIAREEEPGTLGAQAALLYSKCALFTSTLAWAAGGWASFSKATLK